MTGRVFHCLDHRAPLLHCIGGTAESCLGKKTLPPSLSEVQPLWFLLQLNFLPTSFGPGTAAGLLCACRRTTTAKSVLPSAVYSDPDIWCDGIACLGLCGSKL